MKNAISVLILSLLACLVFPYPSIAFYTRGVITRDMSYDRLVLTKPPSDIKTYKPVVSGVIINKTRQKISLSAELSFCNVFGDPLGTVNVRCTIAPMKKAAFKKRVKGNAPAAIKDAHHVEWTILRIKKG